jgi:hypothetical protein
MAPKARRRFKKSTFFKVNSPGLATLRGFASGRTARSDGKWPIRSSPVQNIRSFLKIKGEPIRFFDLGGSWVYC